MRKLILPKYIELLRPVLNEDNTQESVFRLLFYPVINANENGDIDFSSSKISEIMNGKADIPEKVRSGANNPEVKEDIYNNFASYVVTQFREPLKYDLLFQYSELIREDESISPRTKDYYLSLIENDDISEVLTELFLYVVNIPFSEQSEFKICYCSKLFDYQDEKDIFEELKQQFGMPKNLNNRSHKMPEYDKLYMLTTECSCESEYSQGTFMANVKFEYNDKKYEAATSCENWLSQSYLNNILNAKTVNLTLVFKVLNNCTVHIYIAGEKK